MPSVFLWIFLTMCACPLTVQCIRQEETVPPSTTINAVTLSNSLGEYYESITDQVVTSITREILASAHSQFENKQLDSSSLTPFLRSLEHHLHFMRANLIAAVQPLVDSNLPWILSPSSSSSSTHETDKSNKKKGKKGSNTNDGDDDEDENEDKEEEKEEEEEEESEDNYGDDDDDDEENRETRKKNTNNKKKGMKIKGHKQHDDTFPIWSIPLTKDIHLLNQRISTQLGLIINVNQSSPMMIRQALSHANIDHSFAPTRLSSSSFRSKAKNQQRQQKRQQQVAFTPSSKQQQEYHDQGTNMTPTIVIDPVPFHRWLHTWLSHIEPTLKVEFNNRIQDAVQYIMEDFLI